MFDCPLIKNVWSQVCKEIYDVFVQDLNLTPLSCILGLHPALNLNSCTLRLLDVLLFGAKRCILLQWISDKPPDLSQWLQSLRELITLEVMTYWLKNKPLLFYKIWSPFLSYTGVESAQTLQKGLYGLIWSDIPRGSNT